MDNRHVHTIPPVYNEESRILILGTFPSVKSRRAIFYHHPQNQFWKVISAIWGRMSEIHRGKRKLLLRNGIALWDVVYSCDIAGSADSSIKNVVPNDISPILQKADIRIICANGGTAYRLYKKYIYPIVKRDIIHLPSTSPANASYSLERLVEEWSKYIKGKDSRS